MAVAAVNGAAGILSATGGKKAGGLAQDFLSMLQGVAAEQAKAGTALNQLAVGKANLVNTLIATQKADMGLSLTVEARNRALTAYNSIMNMPV